MANTTSRNDSTWGILAHDVGQADAYSILTANERMMVDVDKDQIISALDTYDFRTIDRLLTTHIHEDRVAGLRYLSDAGYTIQQAYRPNANRSEVGNETGYVIPTVLEEYFENLSDLGVDFDESEPVSTGDEISLEGDCTVRILAPPDTDEVIETSDQMTGDPCEFQPRKANPNGAVYKFEGPNGVSGLFMGDVSDEDAHYAESWLIEQHGEVDLNADILFIGRHGSKHGTGERFLDQVDPAHVVISSSLANNHTSENQYDGHPHDETLERLHDNGVAVYWTAVHGTIRIIVADGSIQIEHSNNVETTAAADLGALKYYARATGLDQDRLVDIEEIASTGLPEDAPDWIHEAPIVNEPTQTVTDASEHVTDLSEQWRNQIDDLHALEVEHGRLTLRKDRLERRHERLIAERDRLEQEREATPEMWDRFSDAVGQFSGTTEDADNTAQDSKTDVETITTLNSDQTEDSSDYDQADDIDDAITMLERDNAALETIVESLTRANTALEDDIEKLEQHVGAPTGFRERIADLVTTLGDADQDDQQRIVRQPLVDGALSSGAREETTELDESHNQDSEPVRDRQ